MCERGDLRDVFGRALRRRARPPRSPPFGAEVDDPVGAGDDVEVVLDDDHRVARIAQAGERDGEQLDVREVQAVVGSSRT